MSWMDILEDRQMERWMQGFDGQIDMMCAHVLCRL